jgi:hypothetical protein
VTSDVELFLAGTPNRGWLIRPSSGGGGDGWTLKSSETTADQTQRPTLEVIYSVPMTPYATWAAFNNLGGSAAAATADPERDGAVNLTEFAYNMNPRRSDASPLLPGGTSGLPIAHYLPESGGILEIEFLRRRGPSAEGLTYIPRFSDNLIDWTDGQAPTVTPINADWERVRVRESGSGQDPQRFAKIVITLQP